MKVEVAIRENMQKTSCKINDRIVVIKSWSLSPFFRRHTRPKRGLRRRSQQPALEKRLWVVVAVVVVAGTKNSYSRSLEHIALVGGSP